VVYSALSATMVAAVRREACAASVQHGDATSHAANSSRFGNADTTESTAVVLH